MRKPSGITAAVASAAAAVLLSSCACHGSQESGAPLEGTSWTLASAEKNGAPDKRFFAGGRKPPVLVFTDNHANVTNLCNGLFARYTVKDGTITFHEAGMTRMMCEPDLMVRDDAMARALSGKAAFTVRDGRLILRSESGETLSFTGK